MSRTRGNPAVAGVRYYGYYSPALRGMARGKRKKSDQDELIHYIDYSDSQLLPSDDYLFYDPDYPIEDYASSFFSHKGDRMV